MSWRYNGNKLFALIQYVKIIYKIKLNKRLIGKQQKLSIKKEKMKMLARRKTNK